MALQASDRASGITLALNPQPVHSSRISTDPLLPQIKNSLTILILFSVFLVSSCRREDPFTLSKDVILEDVVKDGGEVVEVVGDPGPFKYSGTFYGNYARNASEASGTGGVSLAGYSMNFEIGVGFYHRIHIYENAQGGGMLVGVRHRVESDDGQEAGEPQG